MGKVVVQQVGSSQASIFGFKLTGIRANETRLSPAYVYDRHRKELSNFINMLYRGGSPITYCLRMLLRPFVEKGQYGDIQIALLIKTEERSKAAVETLAESIRLLLGGVFKNHRWDSIESFEELEAFINPLNWVEANHVEYKRRREKIQYITGSLLKMMTVQKIRNTSCSFSIIQPIGSESLRCRLL